MKWVEEKYQDDTTEYKLIKDNIITKKKTLPSLM